MNNQRIDILEEEILKLDYEVLERLLWDHSRELYPDKNGELLYTFCDYYNAFCRDILGVNQKLTIATMRH